MHYKAISKLKPRRLSFIYLFICQELRGAAEDHSELASICHDGGPGTSALPRLPPTPHTPHHPSLPPTSIQPPLHQDCSLCTAKLPISTCCVITAHSDLYSGESSSTSFGRRKASAPAAFKPHYKSRMRSE